MKKAASYAIVIMWIGIVVVAVALTAAAAMQDPYPLDGYTVDTLGAPIPGANVTFTNLNTGAVRYVDSDLTYGVYSDDVANFAGGYTIGDVIQYYTVFGAYTNTTTHTIGANGATSNTMNITLDVILDSDADGVPDAWDVEPNTPIGYWTDSQGRGRLPGDMNGDGKLSSVDALMILQMAVR